MNIHTYPRSVDRIAISPHFHLSEWQCRCGECPQTLVDLDHASRLEDLRSRLDAPIVITSAFRCRAHNVACGGHPTSRHMEGVATDIVVPGVPPHEVARVADEMGFAGVGRYDTFTHVDSRDLSHRAGRPARWDLRG